MWSVHLYSTSPRVWASSRALWITRSHGSSSGVAYAPKTVILPAAGWGAAVGVAPPHAPRTSEMTAAKVSNRVRRVLVRNMVSPPESGYTVLARMGKDQVL